MDLKTMENFYTNRIHGFPNISNSKDMGFNQEAVLSLIAVLGSSVSLVALVFAFITYSLFSDLRNLSGTALMNLLAALFMNQLLYVIGVGGVQDIELCAGLAFALQYIRLTCFCWLLVMTHHTYRTFKTNMNLVTQPEQKITTSFWQFSLFSWCSPLLFLLTSIFLQSNQRGKLLDVVGLKPTNCWLLESDAYMYGYVMPVVLIFMGIFVHLVKIYIVVRYTVSMQMDKKIKTKMHKKRMLQLKLYIRLAVIMAAVFLASTFYKTTTKNGYWILFNILQSVQGITISLCVTCNCQILKIYTKNFRRKKEDGVQFYGGMNELTKSTSLQLLTWEPPPDTV